jgi:hypothetical protein
VKRRRTDAAHKAVADVLRLLKLPFLDTSAAGKGLEDFVVGLPGCNRPGCQSHSPRFVLLEVKTIERQSTGYVRFKPAQKKWRAMTEGFPRIVATSAEDALRQLRDLTGCQPATEGSASGQ